MAIDPNKIRLTGENSFLRLAEAEGAEPTAQNSHWRVHVSPKGIGHALFTKGQLTDNEARIYADNIALARWLQQGIMASMTPEYGGEEVPVIEAEFSKIGDSMTYWTEYVESEDDSIALSWYDFGEPFLMANAPGENPDQPHGVYSVLIPAHKAQMTLNGQVATGSATPRQIVDRDASSCCLALSETWVIPRDHEWADV